MHRIKIMFREYFYNRDRLTTACAWSGLVVFLLHSLYKAWLKRAINSWYKTFYDHLGAHVERRIVGEHDSGSGDAYDVDEELAHARAAVMKDLLNFAILVAPAVAIHPTASYIRNRWAFAWRCSLMDSYLQRWTTAGEAIEGSAQRVHEDTQRFGSGIHSIVMTIIDSALTLAIFIPLLNERDPMLMKVALAAAFGGIGVSIVVGRHLVGLEVANQKVEGALRTKLVKLELDVRSVNENGGIRTAFNDVIQRLRENYFRLYKNFFFFSWWLSSYDQFMVVCPYFFAAPRLFALNPDNAITLGELTSAMNAFDKVFGSISVISENFTAITDFWSVVRRLRQFERNLGQRPPMLVVELVDAGELDTSPHPQHEKDGPEWAEI